jgi:hypothetical protein
MGDHCDLRERLRGLVYTNPRRAIAMAVDRVVDLWAVLLEEYGHPDITPEKSWQLQRWVDAIHEGVDHAIFAAACEMRLRSGVWPAGSLSKEKRPRRTRRTR